MNKTDAPRKVLNQLMRNNSYEISHSRDINLNNVVLHSHDFYELYFFISGKAVYSVENLHYNLVSGDILLIPPNVLHQLKVTNPNLTYERIVLWLNPRYVTELSTRQTDLSSCFFSCASNRTYLIRDYYLSQKIRDHLLSLELLNSNQKFGNDIEREQKVQSILLDINKYFKSDGFDAPATNARYARQSSMIVSKAMDFVEKNLSGDLSLESISENIFVSKYHLSHLFKSETNITLHQFVLKKRLLYAKHLIEKGSAIKELYLKCGFQDESTFFRSFKSEFAITPNQYRKLLKS
ncbi:MAG: AraC family transcriptional regulator [Treponemataceae bacterium]|nr:AraC family transcriptional regulator [Treponemataceae bacterium]